MSENDDASVEKTVETTETKTVESPSVPDPKEEHRVDTHPPVVERTEVTETTTTQDAAPVEAGPSSSE